MAKQKTKIARHVRPTALVYCEGAHELTFVRQLKKLYAAKSASGAHFSIKKGAGGAPLSLVEDASRIPGDYDRKLVKMDFDRPKKEYELADNFATTRNIPITILKTKPCLDALLLAILSPGLDYGKQPSAKCKKLFEARFIPADKRTNSALYEKHFTKSVIQEARQRLPDLDELIKFFEA